MRRLTVTEHACDIGPWPLPLSLLLRFYEVAPPCLASSQRATEPSSYQLVEPQAKLSLSSLCVDCLGHFVTVTESWRVLWGHTIYFRSTFPVAP